MDVGTWLEGAKGWVDSLDADLIALSNFAPEGADRSWLVSNNVVKITTNTQKQADEMLKKRAAGVPMAYLLHYREFYGRKFQVRPGVLIPRPETETLIDLVKELDLPSRARFLEIGTGCGCIAVTLALEFPQSEVLATDISSDALMVAERNNILHEGRIRMARSDLFDAFGARFHEQFDVIVANMPYVDPNWQWVDTNSLRHEPLEALYALGENGLSIYRRFFEELRPLAEKMSLRYCVVEADPCQHKELTKIATRNGWRLMEIRDYGLCFRKKRAYKKPEKDIEPAKKTTRAQRVNKTSKANKTNKADPRAQKNTKKETAAKKTVKRKPRTRRQNG